MSDPLDQLEKELTSLQPARVSGDLLNSVGRVIGRNRATVHPAHPYRLIGYTAAAIVTLALCLIGYHATRSVNPSRIAPGPLAKDTQPPGPTTLTADLMMPTALAYHIAANQSLDELDALIDQHGRRVLPYTGTGAFMSSGRQAPTSTKPQENTP
ncbi:MAG: hypothetical protein GC164_12825 [Phycisphaera sp.]|nr:hypothetical protein [Phycisphaera sp.]